MFNTYPVCSHMDSPLVCPVLTSKVLAEFSALCSHKKQIHPTKYLVRNVYFSEDFFEKNKRAYINCYIAKINTNPHLSFLFFSKHLLCPSATMSSLQTLSEQPLYFPSPMFWVLEPGVFLLGLSVFFITYYLFYE